MEKANSLFPVTYQMYFDAVVYNAETSQIPEPYRHQHAVARWSLNLSRINTDKLLLAGPRTISTPTYCCSLIPGKTIIMDLLRLRLSLVFTVFIFYTNISSGRSEQSCSKFDYEEKLLEKMIKLDIKFDQMERGYAESKADIAEEKKNIQEEREAMKATFEQFVEKSSQKLTTMEDNVKNERERLVKDVNDASSATARTLQDSEAKLMRLSADLRVFQNETMRELTGLLKTPDVFFSAKDLVDKTMSTKQTFVFPTVTENRGDGYNNASGEFTAPVGGDYIFTTQMCNEYSSYLYLAFVVDDMIHKRMVISRKSGYTCATATLISRLKAGARVAVQSTSSSTVYFDNSQYGSYFSGYLVRKYLP